MSNDNKKKRGNSANGNDSLSLRLKKKMQESGISANALEKQAGLRRSAVHNILYGRSKKPSAEILHAIARVLDCSPAELLTNTANNFLDIYDMEKKPAPEELLLEIALYSDAVKTAGEHFKNYHLKPYKQKALHFIDELYSYSLQHHLNYIDQRFAEWLFKKWWAEGNK